jgi:hypothetical protein
MIGEHHGRFFVMRTISKSLILTVVVLALAGLASAGHHELQLKAGDTVYACNCAAECPCLTLSMKEGKCGCGSDLVKATVKSVSDDGTAMLHAEGWDEAREFKTVGAYVCGCGPSCECGTISQSEGKCGCGADLKKVEG